MPTLADEAYSLPQDKIANIKKLEAGESRTPEMMIADLDNLKVTQSSLVEKLQGLDESFRKIADALDIRDALYSSNFDPPNVKTPTTKARSSRGTSMGNIHGSPASPTSAFASSIYTRPNRNSSISRKWR